MISTVTPEERLQAWWMIAVLYHFLGWFAHHAASVPSAP